MADARRPLACSFTARLTMTERPQSPLRVHCIYCGDYTAPPTRPPSRSPRTCTDHKDLPALDWTYRRTNGRMH